MRDLTIHEVIKSLPLDEETKVDLLTNYESYPENKKFTVTQICWDAFGEMEDVLQSYWTERIMQESAEGKHGNISDLATEVQKKVWQDIDDRITGKNIDNAKLDQVRSQLEKLMDNQ